MYQRIRTTSTPPDPPDATVCLVFSPPSLHEDDKPTDQTFGGRLTAATNRPEFQGERGEIADVYHDGRRALLLGLGEPQHFDAEGMRAATGRLTDAIHRMDVGKAHLHINAQVLDHLDAQVLGRAIGEGVGLRSFEFTQFRHDAEEKPGGRRLALSTTDRATTKAIDKGLKLCESANYTRRLQATPPNIATPDFVAKEARKFARERGLECTVIRGPNLKQRKLVGLMNVGQGSAHPPCLIELVYTPQKKRADTVALVGKTITFDSGGLSLKSPQSMRNMKYDKSGGMAVLGAMHAVSRIKPRCKVVGLLPAAENAVGQQSYRVDDILEYPNDKSVEITNTDAEGRLVLADALNHACKQHKPHALIDLATLTGGVITALGHQTAGLWCDDEALREKVQAASRATGEPVWRMPLFQEHKRALESKHADIVNGPPRTAGGSACTATAFLSHFVAEGTPWAHLDIAGTAERESDEPPFVAGPTGFGVRMLAELLDQWGK